jgi:RND family efflux transporter MFP subunit
VLTAEFRPFQEVDVRAKLAGFLRKIYVDVGDHVRQGQLLAELEIPEMADDIVRARASARLSDANVDRARDELKRAQAAHEGSHLIYTRLAAVVKSRPNLVAQQEIDEAMAKDQMNEAQVSAGMAALTAAEQQVQVAQAELKKFETLDAYTRITAPFTGVVTNRFADTGAMIQAGTASQTQAMPVVRLSQNDLLRLVLPVPESKVPAVKLGDVLEVHVPTLNRTFRGRIARYSGQVSLATRTMETEVDVPNPSLVIMPGMYAEVVLTVERRNGALAVPLEAVANIESSPSVLMVDANDVIRERRVELGLENARRVEIRSGLKEGDLVLVGGRSQFRPGQKISPKVIEIAELVGGR